MFERPLLLWLLMLAPLIAGPGLLAFRSGRRASGALSSLLRLIGFAALVLMMAGIRIPVSVSARKVAVVAALDESRSITPDQLHWMRRQVDAVRGAMAPGDRIAVIGFGRGAKLLSPFRDARLKPDLKAGVDGGATDIASALTTALGLFPEGVEKRLLLLSDGDQTQGSALSEIPALSKNGVRVFTAAPPPPEHPRVALVSFRAPNPVSAYSSFAFRLSLESESRSPVSAEIELFAGRLAVGAEQVTLKPGLNRFELPYQVNRAGAYLMTARVKAAPPLVTLNPSLTAGLSVVAPPRVLVVSSAPPQSLIAALRLRHYRVELAVPRGLTADPRRYLPYQAVILCTVSVAQLAAPVQQALSSYVADLGGGLIVTGDALRDPGFRGSALERTLPITFQPQPQPPSREPIAVYLCIDRSNSMSYDSRYPAVRDFQRIRYAKQAAVALLSQLDDTDYAGVIAFDSQPYILSDLRPLGEDRGALVQKIERLQPGGGTDFLESLEIAERQILKSGIPVREIILLTDGDTNRPYHDHDAIIASLAREHIPVSTIRIGPDLENLRLLQDFAAATGGTFYRVQDIEKLPLLLVHLTRRAMNRRSKGRTRMVFNGPSAVLAGIAPRRIPPIDFYATTAAKDGAAVPLQVRRNGRLTPLLATWQFGLGRSAIFAAEPDSLAALSWIRWDHYAQFWSQLVSWTMRRGDPGMFTLRLTPLAGGGLEITALKAEPAPAGNLVCRIGGAGRAAVDVAMTQVGASLYRAEAAPLKQGIYRATLMLKTGDTERVLISREFAATGVTPADAAELRIRPANLALLRTLARGSGGAFDAPPAAICAHTGATVVVRRTIDGWLIALAILAILGEVFIRRRIFGE